MQFNIINSKFNSYLILLLQIIFSSWSWLFLFFASFALINIKNGGLISGVLFLTNSAVRVVGAKYFAKFVRLYNEHARLYISVVIKGVFILSLLFLPYVGNKPVSLILWTFIINIMLVLDGYLTFHIKYYFSDSTHLSLMRYSSLNNLGSRGSIAIVSIIALSLGQNNWIGLTTVSLALAFTGLLGSCLCVYYSKNYSIRSESHKTNLVDEIFVDNATSTAASLGAHFLFLMNLFYGSTSLLFARAIPEYSLIYFQNINFLTLFYTGFVATNIIGIFFDQLIGAFANWKNLIISYFMMAILGIIFYLLRFSPNACFILAIIWGAVYGWSLTIFFPLITSKIRGDNQAALFAKIDSESRLGFIISQLITGVLLDALIGPIQLLQIYCICSIAGIMLVLLIYKNKLERVLGYDQQ